MCRPGQKGTGKRRRALPADHSGLREARDTRESVRQLRSWGHARAAVQVPKNVLLKFCGVQMCVIDAI